MALFPLDFVPRTVAVVLFDDVEVLDFAGPFEVFSVCGRRHQFEPFIVSTVSERGQTITARNGLKIIPSHSFATQPHTDILIVPGGFGTRREMKNHVMLEWVAARARDAEFVMSVCTGSLILGTAGLLDGRGATTHHLAMDTLRECAPKATIHEGARIVDNGQLLLSSGVSAGIDASLHLVHRLLGDDMARETARYMEYEGNWATATHTAG